MRAMILGAGFGTRLRPLTEELPKPLVPVLGRPLIEHTIRWLLRWGVRDIVINLHHLPDAIPRALGDGDELGVRLAYVREQGRILGTGGGIRGARDHLDRGETFVVVNGDVLLQPDLGRALKLHRKVGGEATLVLRDDPNAERYGALGVDPGGRVRTLLGAPKPPPGVDLRYEMFTGVHLLEPSIFERLPEQGCIVRQVYRPMLDAGEPIGGWIDANPWVELGTPGDYLAANLALLEGRLRFEHIEGPPDGLWIDPTAQREPSSRITAPAAIGAGATIRADVARAVVWPGTLVDAPITDAIATPRGVVRPR